MCYGSIAAKGDTDSNFSALSSRRQSLVHTAWVFLVSATVAAVCFLPGSWHSPSRATTAFKHDMSVETPLLGNSPSTSTSLSVRGQGVKAVRDDIPLFVAGLADPYHPVNNTQGYLVMLVAENKLMWKEMAVKLEELQVRSTPLPEWIFNYGNLTGQKDFCHAMAKVFRNWINAPVNPQNIKVQAGASAVLAQLSYLLGDTDDGVLVTAPNYPAFSGDFGVYGGMKLFSIPAAASTGFVPTRQDLDAVYAHSELAGNPPRIFIICQPNNPTGTMYSAETMKFLVTWALEKGMHVVSDEIYALSVFPGYHTASAADVMRELHPHEEDYLGDYVHIVAGLSKDWGMSGFRVGTLFSHNTKLLQAMDLVGMYPSVSFYTQHALTQVFSDDAWMDWYIAENQQRLYDTYQAMVTALARINVPVTPAQGALFAWVSDSWLCTSLSRVFFYHFSLFSKLI